MADTKTLYNSQQAKQIQAHIHHVCIHKLIEHASGFTDHQWVCGGAWSVTITIVGNRRDVVFNLSLEMKLLHTSTCSVYM